MKLLAALQKEAQKLTKAKDSLERQLNAISAAVKALDRKSTRLNSSHGYISYAVFCLKKNKNRRLWLSLAGKLDLPARMGHNVCANARPGAHQDGAVLAAARVPAAR